MTAAATIPALSASAAEIHTALTLLLAPGCVAEVRCPKTQVATISGYFDDLQAMAAEAADLSGKAGIAGVYMTLNPVRPALLARAVNQIKPYAKSTTNDAEIISRRWLPLDFDPIRPAGISSTDDEHNAALARAQDCKLWLVEQGWPEPLTADSGNGAHLLYRIQLPNDDPSRLLVEAMLKAISQRFSDNLVNVDVSVGNAARIWKIYGTQVQKGDSTADRPHRSAKLLEVPAEIKIVTAEQLQAIAAPVAAGKNNPASKNYAGQHPGKNHQAGKIDAAAWLAQHGIAVESQAPYEGGTKYVLAQCPLNGNHKKTACVIQFASGALSAGCLHESCASLDWKTLRAMYEPVPADWRDGLLLSEKGAIKPVLENVLLVLQNESVWSDVLAYNAFNLSAVTQKPAPWPQSRAGAVWTDFDDCQLCAWLQRYGVLVNSRLAAEAAQTIGQMNPFHPVRDYLKSLVWDGKQRVGTWLHRYLGAENNAYTCGTGTCWLISGVARIFAPGCKVDQILLLEGPQGSLKSTALRTLSGAEFFSDHISDLGSKDSRLELAGAWILELAELDRVRRGELSRVKAFFTAQTDVYRPPYGRRTQRFPRSCIFAATVNDTSTLVDETGNRRWWPVRVGHIDIAALAQDRDQLWAEAVRLYESGAKWWLETPQMNNIAANEADLRYSPGLWDEEILNWADMPTRREKRAEDHIEGALPFVSSPGKVTVSDVLVHAVGKPFDKFAYSDQMQVQRCLTHDGWTRLPQCRVADVTGHRDNRVRFWSKQISSVEGIL